VAAETGQVIDPHTAVAVHAARRIPASATPIVILSTAHAAKFPDAVARAIGRDPGMPDGLKKVMDLPEKLDVLPNDLSLLRKFISNRLGL
jgi:threonine synthase